MLGWTTTERAVQYSGDKFMRAASGDRTEAIEKLGVLPVAAQLRRWCLIPAVRGVVQLQILFRPEGIP